MSTASVVWECSAIRIKDRATPRHSEHTDVGEKREPAQKAYQTSKHRNHFRGRSIQRRFGPRVRRARSLVFNRAQQREGWSTRGLVDQEREPARSSFHPRTIPSL